LGSNTQSATYRLALWLLRSRGGGEEHRFDAYRDAFADLNREQRRDFATAFVSDIIRTTSQDEALPLRAAHGGYEEDIVTLRDKWLEDGEKRGLQKGLELGRTEGRTQGRPKGGPPCS